MILQGKRTRRPALVWAAVGMLGAGAALGVTLVVQRGEPALRYVPWIVFGAFLAFLALMFASMMPRPATLEVAGDELRPSWGGPLKVRGVKVGRWVMPAIDAPVGLALHAGGLRIGGTDHAGDGYAIDARPTRGVDVELAAADLDALAAALGVARTPPTGAIAVELVRSSQSGLGALGMMAPWLITIAVVSVLGVGLGATGLADKLLTTKHGPFYMGIGTTAVVLVGLAWTIVRSMRPRVPAYVLRADATGLTLVDRHGHEVANAPWLAVRAEPRRNVMRTKGGTFVLPALALQIGDRPLAIGCWDHRESWPTNELPKASPPWIAGRPQWRQLIELLRANRRL